MSFGSPLRLLSCLVLAAALPFAVASCGQGSDFESDLIIAEECHADQDQLKSFMPKLPGRPVAVIVDPAFEPSEKSSIHAAVATWNQFGLELSGENFFYLAASSIPDWARNYDKSDCKANERTDGNLYIVKEGSQDHWKKSLGLERTVLAVTERCSAGSRLMSQVAIVNPHTPKEQLQSAILHELGHSLGLDHSCASDQASDHYRSCSDPQMPAAYFDAVMYPTLSGMSWSGRNSSSDRPGSGRAAGRSTKESLQSNDRIRTQCLYGSKK